MTEYLRPGVFVNEILTPLINPNANTIGKAIGTFVGRSNVGPTKPTLVTSWQQYKRLYGGFAQSGGMYNYLPYAVFQFFSNGGGACLIVRIENTDAASASLVADDVDVVPAPTLTIAATSPGAWGDDISVALTASSAADRFTITVYYGGTSQANIVETFVDLSLDPRDGRYALNLVNAPYAGSAYIHLTNQKQVANPQWTYTTGVDNPALFSVASLSGGADGSNTGNVVAIGTNRLDQIDQILNVNLPGVVDTDIINGYIAWAQSRGDVFMVLDGPKPPIGAQTSAQVAQTYLNLATGPNAYTTTSYAAVYGPWLLVKDPASSTPGSTRMLPPGGAVLGVYSVTDTLRGPQKTPAGIHANLANVIDLETRFTSADLDILNQTNINAIKAIPGIGFCVFGGRTLLQGYTARYISIRRTMQALEKDIVHRTMFAVFEPNGKPLWDQVKAVISAYLTAQMQAGVLNGATAEEAFFVICDETNNPPALTMNGYLNIQVGVAIASPAEFVIITISQFQGGGTVTSTNLPSNVNAF